MSRKILLADDSVTIQKVIELTFMDEDYEVKAVSNGDEALAALPNLQPDFVIADVHMPGANGYEVCRRSKEIRPDVPVLLLVGTFEPFDEGQARAAGADSFLKKPFDSQELLQRVQDLLAARPGAPAAAPPPLSVPHAPEPPTLAFDASPFRQPAASVPASNTEPDWGAFQLDPPPQHAAPAFGAGDPFPMELSPLPALEETHPSIEPSPFLEEESPFVLEDDHGAPLPLAESAPLPDDATMFDLDSPAAPSAPPPLPGAAGADHAALGSIDFEELPSPAPRPAAGFGAPWTGEETAAEERLGVPESAVPLVHDLAETEARIEAPAPASILDSHEPEADWSAPLETAPEPWSAAVERPPLPPTAPLTPPPLPQIQPQPQAAAAPPAPAATPLQVGRVATNGDGRLSDEDVDRIARRVVELLGEKTVRDVAWEVIPDLAEVVIRDRLRELESQVETSAE
jgi:CheY-like chemotaxis protein